MATEKTEKVKKTDSRKFVVWLTWLILSLGVLIYTFIAKDTTILEKVLEYFFAVSMLYLGVNVGQKAFLSIADALKEKYANSKEKENE